MSEAVVGDLVWVRAGERAALDGIVASGCAHIDLAWLKGESVPIEACAGQFVPAGALVIDGVLILRVAATASMSTLQRLLNTVEEARKSKGGFEKLTDRVSAVFVPVMVAMAMSAAMVGWRSAGWSEAMLSGLAVLLIACPCALGLATPLAVWRGLGQAETDQVDTSMGNPKRMRTLGLMFPPILEQRLSAALDAGFPIACIGWKREVRGIFTFQEALRPSARQAIIGLQALGCTVSMLTGDHEIRAKTLAAKLGLSYRSEPLPEDKLAAVCDLRRRWGAVAMVGDGVNDAPALAAADVGLAMMGLLSPAVAALAMGLSSLFVLGHSWRLASRPFGENAQPTPTPRKDC